MSNQFSRQITRYGRIALPNFLLVMAGIKAGDLVIMDSVPNGILIRKAKITPDEENISAVSSQMLELLNTLTAEEKQSALRLIYNSLTERNTQIKQE